MNPNQKNHWLILLVLASSALYLHTCGFSYIQLDDPHHIFENPSFLPPTLSKTIRFWIEPFFGMYIPFTYTVWEIAALFSLSPHWFHFLNFIIHTANTLLVFWLVTFLLAPTFKQKNPASLFFSAFLGALFFCWHPVQAESVAWISGMKDVLFSFMLLGAIRSHLKKNLRLSYFLFFLALASKPTAVIGPIVLFVIYKIFVGLDWKESFRSVSIWLLLIIPFAALTKWVQPDSQVQGLTALPTRPLIALDTTLFYLRKTFFPIGLGLDYGRTPQTVLAAGLENLFLLVPVCVLAVTFFIRKKFPWLWGGFCLFLVGFLPVSGLIPFQYQLFSTVADRYLYFSLVGISLAIGYASKTKPTRIAFLGILCLLGALGFRQTLYWRNDDAIFQRALEINPSSFLAHNNYAFYLFHIGKTQEAADHFSRVVELKPDKPELRVNYAVALDRTGEKQKSIEQLEIALRADPGNPIVKKLLEIAKNRPHP